MEENGTASNLKVQMEASVKNLKKTHEKLYSEVQSMFKLKKELHEQVNVAKEQKLAELNEGKEEDQKLTRLPDEEYKKIMKEFTDPEGDFYKQLKAKAEAFFEEKQELKRQEEENLRKYMEAKDQELNITVQRIEQINSDLEGMEADDPKRAELEKELAELTQYQVFLTDQFEQQLGFIKKELHTFGDKMNRQKTNLNEIADGIFHPKEPMVKNSLQKKKNERENGQERGAGRQSGDSGEREQDEGEEPGTDTGAGVESGTGAQQRSAQGMQQPTMGGYSIPFVGGAMSQQASTTRTAEGQAGQQRQQENPQRDSSEQPEQEEPLERIEYLLAYEGTLNVTKALDVIKRYSELNDTDRAKALKNGELKTVEEATEKLLSEGGKLSKTDRALLETYSKNIETKYKAYVMKVEKARRKPDGRYPLSEVLGVDVHSEEYDKLKKYIDPVRRSLFGMSTSKNAPALFDYDSLDTSAKRLIEDALTRHEEQRKERLKEIRELQTSLNDPNLTSEEKKERKELIADVQVRLADSEKAFDRIFGDVVRTGKGFAQMEKIKEMSARVKTMPYSRESREQGSFEEELGGQTRGDDERADEKQQKIDREYQRIKEEFAQSIKDKLDNGEKLSFQEYAQYMYYINNGDRLEALTADNNPTTIRVDPVSLAAAQDRVDDSTVGIQKKVNDLRGKMDRGEAIQPSELLTAEEINIMIGLGKWNPGDRKIQKFATEDVQKEYFEKYDPKYQAKKHVEEEQPAREEEEPPEIV